jgi:hypothetical protein
MELIMKVNGILLMRLGMDVAIRFGLMEVFMKVTGKMIKLTEGDALFTRMGMFITVSGRTTRLMVTVATITLMEQSTRANGLKTSNMVMARRSGQTMPAMKVNTKTAKSTAKDSFCGLMDRPIQVTFSRITSTAKECTRGRTVVGTADNGATIRCMGSGSSLGRMAANTKACTTKTKKKVVACSLGRTTASMTDSGSTANSTDWASTTVRAEK